MLEPQPPFDKPHIVCDFVDVLVEPAGIGAGWDEKDDRSPIRRRFPPFSEPLANSPTIGWVAEYLAIPRLLKPVVILGVIPGTLVVVLAGSNIEREAKLII